MVESKIMVDSIPQAGKDRQGGPRLPLVDVARGVMLLAMASYHFSWDLANVRLVDWGVATDPVWRAYAAAIAGSFLFLSGISYRLAARHGVDLFRYGSRLIRVALAAAAVSAATYVVFPDAWVFFGILHMMLVASLLAPLLVRLPSPLLLLLGAGALVLPHVWRSSALDGMAFGFLGLGETPPVSNDLVPIFPWIAPYILGLLVGGPLSRHDGQPGALRRGTGWLALIGRHSLIFYLVHQPLLYGAAVGLAGVLPVDPAVQRSSFVSDCRRECSGASGNAELCERFCGCVTEAIDGTGIWSERVPDHSYEPMIATAVQACQQPVDPSQDPVGAPSSD